MSLDSYACFYSDFAVVHAVVIKRVFSFVDAIGNPIDRMTHEPRGVIDQVRCIRGRLSLAAPFDNFQQTGRAGFEGTDLRLKIAVTFIMTANVCEDQSHHVFVKLAVSDQTDWWNT